MEHENAYALMMDALDGELVDDANKRMLEAHLSACPTCLREWRALLAIEKLLREAPMLEPAADFALRTIARLPSARKRRWAMGALYLLLLLGGALPLLLGLWLAGRLALLSQQPGLLPSLWVSIAKSVQVVGTVIGALFNSAGELLVQQPTIIGWLLVMAGIVFVWSGVVRQLVSQTQEI